MALAPGTRLGPYEIVAPIGAGGMGEVYRARDTRLERTVAVKVLPPHVAQNPEARQRFEREARAVSSLNHPHICTLHDIGQQDGVDFLVMEHLEGETLATRLTRGALPIEQVLQYGIEIADALAQAHRKGVYHRDLKPGNIMLTRSGSKLLDFGLAKLRQQGAAQVVNLSALPTQADGLTQKGTILGTMQYMAPEQLEGKETDARTDIFAFGAVIHEMATGRKAFEGSSHASVIGAILRGEPLPVSSLQPMSPPALDRLVKTCLAKDPEERWQNAQDLKRELEWISPGAPPSGAPVSSSRPAVRPTVWMAATAILLVATVALGLLYWRRAPDEVRPIRSVIPPPERTTFDSVGPFAGPVEISPDGRRLAFSAIGADGRRQLWVRSLDSLAAQALPGTEGVHYPFWSADSRYIGFFAAGKLKKIEASGGPAQTICDAEEGRGGTWNRDGVVVFTPSFTSPLLRVSANGGSPAPVTKLDPARGETNHRWPRFLPDGRHFLYSAMRPGAGVDSEVAGIYLGSLDSGQSTLLVRALSNAVYASGYLLFAREGTLLAHRFDPNTRRLTGEAFPLVEQIQPWTSGGRATFSVSENGIMVYQGAGPTASRLLWLDRTGKQVGSLGEPAGYGNLDLSRDNQRAAVDLTDVRGGPPDLWVYEVARGLGTRFTFGSRVSLFPVWSPDGGQIAFTTNRKGQFDLYRKGLSGGGSDEALLESDQRKYPASWSPDGKFLLYETLHPQTKWDLWVLPLTGERKPFAFAEGAFNERRGRFSPNGRWIAYSSEESGNVEVYAAPFRGGPSGQTGGKVRISASGGALPRWRGDGRELYYLAADGKMMAVEIREEGSALKIGAVQPLFLASSVAVGRVEQPYDVSADGKRFLVNAPAEQGSTALTLVVNWTAGLKR